MTIEGPRAPTQGTVGEEQQARQKYLAHLPRHLPAKLLSRHPGRYHHRVRGLSVSGRHAGSHHRVLLFPRQDQDSGA